MEPVEPLGCRRDPQAVRKPWLPQTALNDVERHLTHLDAMSFPESVRIVCAQTQTIIEAFQIVIAASGITANNIYLQSDADTAKLTTALEIIKTLNGEK